MSRKFDVVGARNQPDRVEGCGGHVCDYEQYVEPRTRAEGLTADEGKEATTLDDLGVSRPGFTGTASVADAPRLWNTRSTPSPSTSAVDTFSSP